MRTLSWIGLVISVVAVLGLGACSSTRTRDAVGGETNWLTACDEDAACGAYGSCMCNLCSEGCDEDQDCPDGLICQPPESALVTGACGAQSERGMCAPACEQDDECGSAQACVQGGCAPTNDAPSGGIGDAYIVNAIKLDADCTASPDSEAFMPIGSLDVAARAPGGCGGGYRPSFKVASFHDDLIQVSGAEVRLMDIDRATILFDRQDPPVPNPREVIANQTLLPSDDGAPTLGVVTLELIPERYREELDGFDGQQLIAEIKLHARDANDQSLTIPTFQYVIDVCNGCMTLCGGELDSELSDEEIYGSNVCIDNAGADGRICVNLACEP